jgi:hypothetical protein
MKDENQRKNITGNFCSVRCITGVRSEEIDGEDRDWANASVCHRRRGSSGRLLASFFCAVDGPVRVLIEADNEDDARCLCREMAFEFICSYD